LILSPDLLLRGRKLPITFAKSTCPEEKDIVANFAGRALRKLKL
jgi:hypothetical protein